VKGLVSDLTQDRVHHDEQPHGYSQQKVSRASFHLGGPCYLTNWYGDANELALLQSWASIRDKVS
jgi:hypothetical protein